MCVVYVCAHNDLGCKDTKKNPYIQIYGKKSAKYFSFARKSEGFGEFGFKIDKKSLRKINHR